MSQAILDTGIFLYLQGPGAQTDPDANGDGGSGAEQVYTDSFSDPNGNVTPTDPTKGAWYYQDEGPLVWWQWSVNSQLWYQVSG